MSGQLVIDPVRFARDRVRLTGSLGAAALPRLVELLSTELLGAKQFGADQVDARDADVRDADAGHANLERVDVRRAGAGDWSLDYEVSLEYEVIGRLDDRGRPALHLRLDGTVMLRCQRCLGALPTRIDAQREFVLVAGADEFAPFDDEDESIDIIPAVPRLDLRELMEDEVLLGLPVAPRHAQGACLAGDAPRPAQQAPPSAFAALAKLRHD